MSAARSVASIALGATFAFGVAFAGLAQPTLVSAATPIPKHVFTPYFETWTGDKITTVAQESGARYFTLAFLETLGRTLVQARLERRQQPDRSDPAHT